MLLLIGPAYPLRGGIAHFTGVLAQHLTPYERVETLTFSRQYPRWLFPGTSQDDSSEKPLFIETRQTIDSANPFSWFRTAREGAKNHPRCALIMWYQPFFGPCLGTIARSLRKRGVSRIIALAHNVVPHERNPWDVPLARYFFRACDHVVVLSQQSAGEMESVFPSLPVTTLYLPVYDFFREYGLPTREEARASLGLDPAAPTALFFGLVRKYKGVQTLLEAAAKTIQPIQIFVAGEFYALKEECQAFIAAHGLQDRVRLVDRYLPNEEVPSFFQAADVVVLPYHHASQSAVAQIAVSFQKPIIASAVGGLAEVVEPERTGFLVPPQDPAALASALDRFFSEGWSERMSPYLAHQAGKFSWEQFTETVLKVTYEEQQVDQYILKHKYRTK